MTVLLNGERVTVQHDLGPRRFEKPMRRSIGREKLANVLRDAGDLVTIGDAAPPG